MYKFILSVLIFIYSTALLAIEVELPSGKLIIDIPQGFTELNKDEISAKFGRASNPSFRAFGDAEQDATIVIAAQAQNSPLPETALSDLKVAMEKKYTERVEGLKLNQSRIINLNKKSWLLIDTTHPTPEYQIRTTQYTTIYRGNNLIVSISSSVSVWENFKNSANKLINNIKLM
jgi:hypothetical protein